MTEDDDWIKIDQDPPAEMLATASMIQLFTALGCDPPLCHGCGQIMVVNQALGVNADGHFTHLACRKATPVIVVEPELLKKVRACMRTLMEMEKPQEALDAGWKADVRTNGCSAPAADVLAWLSKP